MKLFIFGSTGDLVRRKVMRGLQDLFLKDLEIIAIGRKEMSGKEYEEFICSDWCDNEFRKKINYALVDFNNINLDNFLDKNNLNYFYISLPPNMGLGILNYLGELKKKGYLIKILSEKPFGSNLKEAIELKEKLILYNLEDSFFISDHYLFKKAFINLKKDFKKIKIVSIEKVGLEGRISYYDSVGALKDMVQSHFLNLIIVNLKFKFNLEGIKILNFEKGQYKKYLEELGHESNTETFVSLKFNCCGKEFEFITGKSFDKKESFIEIDSIKHEDFGDNSYTNLFNEFFFGEGSLFVTIEDSILAWRIIEKIEAFGKDLKLNIY